MYWTVTHVHVTTPHEFSGTMLPGIIHSDVWFGETSTLLTFIGISKFCLISESVRLCYVKRFIKQCRYVHVTEVPD